MPGYPFGPICPCTACPCPPLPTSSSPIWTRSVSPTRRSTHPPLFTVDQSRALRGAIPGAHTKNLFLRDKKGAAVPRRGAGRRGDRAQVAAPRCSALRPLLVRLGRPDARTARRRARLGHAVCRDQRQGLRVTVVLDAAMMAHAVLNFHPLVNTGDDHDRAGRTGAVPGGDRPPAADRAGSPRGRSKRRDAVRLKTAICIQPRSFPFNRAITGRLPDRLGPKRQGAARTMLQQALNAAAAADASGQGHDDADLRQGRHRGIEAPAGAGRFLGALVRPVQAAHARPGKGGQGRQGQGQARQDEHRRASGDPRPDGHPVDPGRDRLRQRPAGRRLHGRAAGKPGRGVPGAADQGPHRRRGEGSAQGGRRRAGRRRCRRRGRPLCAASGGG